MDPQVVEVGSPAPNPPAKDFVSLAHLAPLPEQEVVVVSQVPVSPTGLPRLPDWVPPVATAIGSVAFAVSQIAPEHTVAHKVSVAVLGFLTLVGLNSHGWRKK